MTILFALLSVLIGLSLVFGGYRLARIAIPLLGFIAGLSLGGAVYADMADTPILGSFAGVLVGLVAGLFLGALAYLYYYVAVLVMTASLGYWAGSSFVLLFGFSPGILSALIGIGAGILAGIGALALNAPKYVLIALTSIAGAVATIGGVMLLFHVIPLSAYSYTTAQFFIANSFWWSLAGIALIVLGLMSQPRTLTNYEFEEWSVSDHTHHAPPTSYTQPHAS